MHFRCSSPGMTLDQVAEITGITPFWLLKIQNIVDVERALAAGPDEAIIKSQTVRFY